MKVNIFFLFFLFSTSLAFGESEQSEPLKFKAKRHFQDLATGKIILEGEAVVLYSGSELKAGNVVLERQTNELTATDNVFLNIPSEQTFIKAHQLKYNYKTRLGEMIQAEVRSGFSRFRAKKIIKTGEKKYHIVKGYYSTCDVKEDETCPWQIWSYQADVTIGNYATAEHPIFLAGGIPVFYSPFIFFPVKSERQTGFLMPDFGGSELGGFQLKNALFLALGRTHDATASLEYFSKRGFKDGLEYRYVLSDLSSGAFNGYYVKDREFFKDFGYRDRYAGSYDHQWYFTPRFFNKATVRLVSDDDYVKDFVKDIEGRQEAGLETKVLQGLHWDNFAFNLEGIYYQSLLNTNPQGTNKDIIHKLPEFRADALETNYFGLPLFWSGSFSYVRYFNRGDPFKDLNANGVFDPGTDKILRDHRFDLFPKVSLPIKFQRYFEFVPRAGVRRTWWRFPVGERQKNRSMLDFDSLFTTNVNRIFNIKRQSVNKIKHIIEPRLTYHYSPFTKLDNFIPVFDGLDELGTTHTISWGLQNRLVFKTLTAAASSAAAPLVPSTLGAQYFDGARLDMNQEYNILEARRTSGTPRPWSDIKSILSANLFNFSSSTELDYNMYGDRVSRVSQGMSYVDPLTNVHHWNATYQRKGGSKSINGGSNFNFIDILKFNYLLNYSFDKDQFLEKIFQVVYLPKTKCWALNMNFEDKTDSGFSFTVKLNVMFGEKFLSLAELYQQREQQNITLFSGQGGSDDLTKRPTP
ncbi:MAG: LPS-assembly protein LptD [Deltaproteobacteria bacterium]|nr:LPS-assembly protein LptD [Deltaproteobacteria bacterium]